MEGRSDETEVAIHFALDCESRLEIKVPVVWKQFKIKYLKPDPGHSSGSWRGFSRQAEVASVCWSLSSFTTDSTITGYNIDNNLKYIIPLASLIKLIECHSFSYHSFHD